MGSYHQLKRSAESGDRRAHSCRRSNVIQCLLLLCYSHNLRDFTTMGQFAY
ncbi:hypothetical protein SAMN06265380_1231 [Ruegeria faecimaris]|uniref:Uncharacterized protein n=1 Tax=Ruegeria faecimaris TaxID=686389 RepID=A0A521FGC2_9RHOB|nr:hypothetical protein SAMN06265380_1231 [Ruegeria faecimaris]